VTVWVHGNWHDVAFADLLEERLSLPVRIANRAKVAALGERWHGIAQGVDDLAYVYAGTGIGAGLVIDGSLYSGANGTAGELGHTTVDPDGPLCTCGNRGCLHALASESAIVSRARDKAKTAAGSALLRSVGGEIESITFEAVVRAARAGDQAAREIFHDVGTVLGIGIANLANLFNPRMVVIGGPIAEAEDAVLEPIRQEVARRAYSEARVDLTIARSRLGAQEAGAIGAAALFLEQRGSLPRLSPPRTPLIRRRRAKPGPRRPSERREGAPAHSPRRRNRNPPARRA
jgi:predicted NBD/HSP70 family sugar kinase